MWQGCGSSGGEWPGRRAGCRAAAAGTALAPVCPMAVCLAPVWLVMPGGLLVRFSCLRRPGRFSR
jgi:hypothetical protein